MPNKMLIDASHPEETRVVVLKGSRVEEFDFESVNKKPLRGNIYLAKVTRVEPSLQAAFVDYGGNRHGFLAFSEIHPDYYQIPVADRRALLEEDARAQRDLDEEPGEERRSRRRQRGHNRPARADADVREAVFEPASSEETALIGEESEALPDLYAVDGLEAPQPEAPEAWIEEASPALQEPDREDEELTEPASAAEPQISADPFAAPERFDAAEEPIGAETLAQSVPAPEEDEPSGDAGQAETNGDALDAVELEAGATDAAGHDDVGAPSQEAEEEDVEPIEHIGGDAMDETPRPSPRARRQYKIQEVIKRRQVMLVQVVKEERGNKGAALTTYLSLAGRYSVLMPNTARGGGISRKITNSQDRDRLKDIADELDVPEGMGVILRTAGASRTKQEIKRDFEYLLRMWETVREMTLASSAPTLVYEEGSLIKRAIRDLFSKDVEEITVAGEAGYREAKDFMRLLMPSHVDAVRLYRETTPVFAKAGVEAQLDAMFSNQVTLKSGGYIVINQTEALVAIDVNSGRSTREHNIEDTALRTNLEAADEIARQLRLRDLAGLIVVDFIDMEEMRNNRAVERRVKDALKNDRARIQVGRISHFGLLEMSRQRIRSGVLEGSTVPCPHCLGAGVVRSTASVALHVLRVIEDALLRSASHDLVVKARTPVALYILNHKRSHLRELEDRFAVAILVEADDSLAGANMHVVERGEPAAGAREAGRVLRRETEEPQASSEVELEESEDESAETAEAAEEVGEGEAEAPVEANGGDLEPGRRRRRRRRRRGSERENGGLAAQQPQPEDEGPEGGHEAGEEAGDERVGEALADGEESRPASRRGRRRRGRRSRFGERSQDLASQPQGAGGFEGPIDHDASQPAVEPEAFEAEPTEPLESDHSEIVETAQSTALPASLEAGQIAAPSEAPAPEMVAAPVEPRPEEPPRPRRTGWWQKARTTLMGE